MTRCDLYATVRSWFTIEQGHAAGLKRLDFAAADHMPIFIVKLRSSAGMSRDILLSPKRPNRRPSRSHSIPNISRSKGLLATASASMLSEITDSVAARRISCSSPVETRSLPPRSRLGRRPGRGISSPYESAGPWLRRGTNDSRYLSRFCGGGAPGCAAPVST
jgi:hypothetical protein